MGGKGSGPRKRLTDAEAKAKGTYHPKFSEEAVLSRQIEKVLGVGTLSGIPEPDLPLGKAGLKKYEELTTALLAQGKLTQNTASLAQQAAVCFQSQHAALAAGKQVSAKLVSEMRGVIAQLGIAENAKPIPSPEQKRNRFEICGFANRPRATAR